jgi:small acid-soluble spore protein P (minor)
MIGGIFLGKPKGLKQQEHPNLPESPNQPYGEPLSGSKKVKTANHAGQKHNPHHGL